MEIGSRLKKARTDMGLTQEKVAAEIGVSRQRVSNWENNRAYPDIVSVIKLSDLYSVSLDELLKEDKKMIEHLDDATNTVESRRKFSRLIEIGIYLLIWVLIVILFHVVSDTGELNAWDLIGYVWVAHYLVLPTATLVISVFVGLENGKARWFLILFFGAMYMLAWLSTLGARSINAVIEHFDYLTFFVGGVFSFVGMVIGALLFRGVRKIAGARKAQRDQHRNGKLAWSGISRAYYS